MSSPYLDRPVRSHATVARLAVLDNYRGGFIGQVVAIEQLRALGFPEGDIVADLGAILCGTMFVGGSSITSL